MSRRSTALTGCGRPAAHEMCPRHTTQVRPLALQIPVVWASSIPESCFPAERPFGGLENLPAS